MKPLLLLDLDRTLFKTDDFLEILFKQISLINGKQISEIADVFYSYRNNPDARTRVADYDNSLETLRVPKTQLEKELLHSITPDLLLYDDVKDFVGSLKKQKLYDYKVLTLGEPWSQQLKVKLCPFIGDLILEVVNIRKNQYIAKKYAARCGILVDDVHNQELPANWLEVHVDRKHSSIKPIKLIDNCWRITNLNDMKGIMRSYAK
jgi:hypothetical protein